MKAYVWTTGLLFGAITIAHILRMFAEHLGTDPWYLLITAIAAALCLWAGLLVWRSARS